MGGLRLLSGRLLLYSTGLLLPCGLYGQGFELLATKSIGNIEGIVADHRPGAIISKANGDIDKINIAGEVQFTFSPIKNSPVKQIDVWSPFKVLAFYDTFQEIVVLNRFLAETVRYDLNSFEIGFVSNVALNFQQKLWIMDESDFSLKLLDLKNGQVLIEQPFFQFLDVDNHEISFMKEYKGHLYVVDKFVGVLIFDNLGNLVKKIERKGVEHLAFENDKLYYLDGNKLIFQGLYDATSEEITLPEGNYKSVQKSKDYFFCASDSQLRIYRYLRED